MFNQPVSFDIAEVPQGPADIPPIDILPPPMQRLIAKAKQFLDERPVATRRALMNCIAGPELKTVGPNVAKCVYQYVGYIWASGPWRDGVTKFGVDPRKDPECRKYQTMMFMLDKEPKDNRAKYMRPKTNSVAAPEASKNSQSHLFDGKTVSKDGKVWQVCDISDPLLAELLATSNLRQECDVRIMIHRIYRG